LHTIRWPRVQKSADSNDQGQNQQKPATDGSDDGSEEQGGKDYPAKAQSSVFAGTWLHQGPEEWPKPLTEQTAGDDCREPKRKILRCHEAIRCLLSGNRVEPTL